MKTFIYLLSLLVFYNCTHLVHAQTINYPETYFNNGQFNAITGWSTSSSTWQLNNGTVQYSSGSAVSNANITQSINNIPVINGFIFIHFDMKLYQSSTNKIPTLSVSVNDGLPSNVYTTYLSIIRDNNAIVRMHWENGAFLLKKKNGWTNSADENNMTRIYMKIPVNTAAATVTRSIRFNFNVTSSGSGTSAVRIDNVSYLNPPTTNYATASTCPECILLSTTGSGEIDYGEVAPVQQCGEAIISYKYYLPPVAGMPFTLDSSAPAFKSEIQITTEVPNATVTVRRPDGTLLNTYNIVNNTALIIPTTLTDMFTRQYNSPYTGKGYIFESSEPVTIKWSLDHVYNRMAVVLKGENAVGRVFRIASIYNADLNSTVFPADGNHYYTVMALEDNTKVQIAKSSDSGMNTADFNFTTLNKGQMYTSVNDVIPMSGRLIMADKPIVVASGQQHVRIVGANSPVTTPTSTSLEGTVLQVSPVYGLGKEYIVLHTQGWYGYQVIGTQNNTEVFVGTTKVATINAGETYQFFNQSTPANINGVAFRVATTKPAYVYNIGSNSIGEFEMFPAPPVDLPVGKAGQIVYGRAGGMSGWVIVNSSEVGQLRRNGSATLSPSKTSTMPGMSGVYPAKTILYWDSTFAPNVINNLTCINCSGMYVGQLNDGGLSGAQVGYITSYDKEQIQFLNPQFLPAELLTHGYIFDTANYYPTNPGMIRHKIIIAGSAANIVIDSVKLIRTSGNPDAGGLMAVYNDSLVFDLATPATSTVPPGTIDTLKTTVYLSNGPNRASLCLSYLLMNYHPLPVTLLSFDAVKKGNTAVLNWATGNERDNKGFAIQKSNGHQDWLNIGWVPSNASNGTTQLRNEYQLIDAKPYKGTNMYRLAQEDNNGYVSYSTIRMLEFDDALGVMIYPNPTNRLLTIAGLQGNETIRMFDATGRLLISNKVGTSEVQIDVSKYINGVYLLQIESKDGSMQYEKIVKN